jgi:hypothetical protein
MLLAIGLVGWALPFVPGAPLVAAALPMACCVHPAWERAVRRRLRRLQALLRARRRRKAAARPAQRRLAALFEPSCRRSL